MKVAQSRNITSANADHSVFFQKESRNNFFGRGEALKPFFNANTIQAKLTIGQPNDPYEKEADAMADKVVQRLTEPNTGFTNKNESIVQAKPIASPITPFVQTKCAACEQEEKLQKKDEMDEEGPQMEKLQTKPIFESNAEPPEDENNIQRKCAECEKEEKLQKKEDEKKGIEKDKLQTKPIFESNARLSDDENNIQRKCAQCEKEDEKKVQTKTENNSIQNASSSIETTLNSSKGSGSPLPDNFLHQMESSFGVDFSNVRLHTGGDAVQMNKDLSAQAFTHGSDIYFNSGKYDSNSNSGKHLLAHELTHVVQQNSAQIRTKQTNESIGNVAEVGSSQALSKPTADIARSVEVLQAKLAIGRPNNPYEHEAEVMTDKIVQRSETFSGNGNHAGIGFTFSGHNNSLIQRSPLSDLASSYWDPADLFTSRDRIFDLLRNSQPSDRGDSETRAYIDAIFTDPDDLILAHALIDYGAEPFWPSSLIAERHRISQKAGWLEPDTPVEAVLGITQLGRDIKAYFFPGQTDNRALIIGGMHGSELSGVEVSEILIQKLSTGPMPYYTVVIVPQLFPDNVAKGEKGPIETPENFGRYTKGQDYRKGKRPKSIKAGKEHSKDPNRQFPPLGEDVDISRPTDDKGDPIEAENILLLELIDRFRPTRIANIHSNHQLINAGIYADPRADSSGVALGYKTDEDLALEMARKAKAKGAKIAGNFPKEGDTGIYPLDPEAAKTGERQEREEEKGISLGGWGSTAICNPKNPMQNRPAMRVITVEINEAFRTKDKRPKKRAARAKELEAHADVLREIFLGSYQVESPVDPCLKQKP